MSRKVSLRRITMINPIQSGKMISGLGIDCEKDHCLMEMDADLGCVMVLWDGEKYPAYTPLSNVISMIGVEVDVEQDEPKGKKSK
jgi:hypothetical protein